VPRRPRRFAPRAGAWLERVGGVAVLRLWSILIRLLALAAVGLETVLVEGWHWLRCQRLAVKLAVAAVLVIVALLIGRRTTTSGLPLYITDDAEALARVIRSEVGSMDSQAQLHVAWVTRNLAAERRQTIARMACTPCGEQGPARPVSSRQDATDASRALASMVLAAPSLLDPTGGATHFINPVLQDELATSGRLPGYVGNSYAVVRRRWMQSYGWAPYYRLGPTLEFWGPAHPRPIRRPKRR
jgi:hypothetical protein